MNKKFGAEDFIYRLDGFLSNMKKVKNAGDYNDSFGRRYRSDNVFVIPISFKEDFLKFLEEADVRKGGNLVHNLEEGIGYPFSTTTIKWHDGEYVDHGTYVNYDGFLECDREGINLKCVGWTMCSFSTLFKRMGRVYKKVHENRGFRNFEWVDDFVIEDEPIVNDKLTRYYQYGDGWTSSKWVADRNVICFIG